jgi:hypothetical protein
MILREGRPQRCLAELRFLECPSVFLNRLGARLTFEIMCLRMPTQSQGMCNMSADTGEYQIKRPNLTREGDALQRSVRSELEWTRRFARASSSQKTSLRTDVVIATGKSQKKAKTTQASKKKR